MKAKRIYKEYTYHQFNPLTNEMEFDRSITVNREMTPAEKKKYFRFHRFAILCSIFSVVLIVAGVMLPLLASEKLIPYYFNFGLFFVVVAVFPIRFGIECYCKCENLLGREFLAVGFEEYDNAYEDSEEYQHDCAEVWRATHPLEEKIRLAQQSGNCVDIANLVRHCETYLIDKINYQ